MNGLVAYDDDSQSDGDDTTRRPRAVGSPSKRKYRDAHTRSTATDDISTRHGSDTLSGPQGSSKPATSSSTPTPTTALSASLRSQVIIRRPVHTKTHPRIPLPDDEPGPSTPVPTFNQPPVDDVDEGGTFTPPDELVRIRALLRPPPISGVDDWGIPPPPTGECDPEIEAKLAQFHALKRDPAHPKHFNDSLMANRSFRNPHMYAKLVEFVDVDERTSNFPLDVWDPLEVRHEWSADRIAVHQKMRSEQQAAAQANNAGKRTHLDFTSAKTHSSSARPRGRDHGGADHKGRYQPYGHGSEKTSRWK